MNSEAPKIRCGKAVVGYATAFFHRAGLQEVNVSCRTILMIEPEERMRHLLEPRLKERGYTVRFARDGKEALEFLLGVELPDVILLELELPTINGWEFLRIQKSTQKTKHIPTLVFSSGRARVAELPRAYRDYDAHLDSLVESLDRLCAAKQKKDLNRNLLGLRIGDRAERSGQLNLGIKTG
ncbi:MAG: response regulator [Proteobacteria bacterium]|nr:MAG: response regulator [Pseudomonadota bacterium]